MGSRGTKKDEERRWEAERWWGEGEEIGRGIVLSALEGTLRQARVDHEVCIGLKVGDLCCVGWDDEVSVCLRLVSIRGEQPKLGKKNILLLT
jgi:hypothetical protein